MKTLAVLVAGGYVDVISGFVQVCTCVVLCTVHTCIHTSLSICDHLSECVCVVRGLLVKVAGATFSFTLRSRRSLEQRSLILSAGACGLEACCCLLAYPPLCSCRPRQYKSPLAQLFHSSLRNKSQSQSGVLYRLLIVGI